MRAVVFRLVCSAVNGAALSRQTNSEVNRGHS